MQYLRGYGNLLHCRGAEKNVGKMGLPSRDSVLCQAFSLHNNHATATVAKQLPGQSIEYLAYICQKLN
jgi:hypothetical protein